MKRQRFHFYIGHVLPTVSCGSSREHSRESNLDAVVSTRSCHEVLACRTAGVSGKLRGIPRGSEGSRGPIRSEPDESLPATPHPARIMIHSTAVAQTVELIQQLAPVAWGIVGEPRRQTMNSDAGPRLEFQLQLG